MRLVLYVTLLSALIALVLSAPSVPLRGSLSSSQLGNSRSAPASDPSHEGDGVESTEAQEGDSQNSTTHEGQQEQPETEVGASTTQSTVTTGSSGNGDNSGTVDGNHSTSADSTSQPTGSGSGTTTESGSGEDDVEADSSTSTGSPTSGSESQEEPTTAPTSTSTGSPTSGSASQEGPTTAPTVCGEKFAIWFSGGVPVTTVNCGPYTGIYYPTTSGGGEPKYISGSVESVEVTGGVIKVNGKDLSLIPVKPEAAGGNGAESEGGGVGGEGPAKSRSRRSLQDVETVAQIVDVYSFTAGGKSFTVKLPKEADEEKRNKYILADDGGDVIFEGTKKEEFHFDNDGDLLDSQNHVILQGDGSTSSAFDLKYIIPSISAFVLSILLF